MKTLSIFAVATFGLVATHHFVIAQSGNYFAGTNAGKNNSGSYVTFVGYDASGYGNSAWFGTSLGFTAGYYNTTGDSNTNLGAYAGYTNTTGSGNTNVGHNAGVYNNGNNNSCLGYYSGFANQTGINNSLFGSYAGYSNTASDNSFFGYVSGQSNTSGNWNAFFGSNTGTRNTTGNNNTFVGMRSGPANTTGYRNAFFGTESGMLTTTGRENTFIGRGSGRNNNTGSFNTMLGNYAQPSTGALNYATAIGHKAYVRVSNAVVLGSINGENSSTVTTKVGIGTSAPAYLLHVNGVAAKPGGGSWTVASDKRLKKDIEPFREGLTEILKINPVWFRYNGKAGMPTEKRYVGVIAQEMQKVAPHTISEFTYEEVDGGNEKYLDYDANAVNYMLINAVKELSAELKQVKEELAAMKKGTLPDNAAVSAARLWQNAPNPYDAYTKIRYYIPENSGDASIHVFSISGQEVYSRQLSTHGEGEIEISNNILSAGSYVYQLVVNGNVVDSKKMIVTRD